MCGEVDLGADEDVVRVEVRTGRTVGVLYAVQVTLPGQDHVQLVPMFGSRVVPSYFVLALVFEECVCYCEISA